MASLFSKSPKLNAVQGLSEYDLPEKDDAQQATDYQDKKDAENTGEVSAILDNYKSRSAEGSLLGFIPDLGKKNATDGEADAYTLSKNPDLTSLSESDFKKALKLSREDSRKQLMSEYGDQTLKQQAGNVLTSGLGQTAIGIGANALLPGGGLLARGALGALATGGAEAFGEGAKGEELDPTKIALSAAGGGIGSGVAGKAVGGLTRDVASGAGEAVAQRSLNPILAKTINNELGGDLLGVRGATTLAELSPDAQKRIVSGLVKGGAVDGEGGIAKQKIFNTIENSKTAGQKGQSALNSLRDLRVLENKIKAGSANVKATGNKLLKEGKITKDQLDELLSQGFKNRAIDAATGQIGRLGKFGFSGLGSTAILGGLGLAGNVKDIKESLSDMNMKHKIALPLTKEKSGGKYMLTKNQIKGME